MPDDPSSLLSGIRERYVRASAQSGAAARGDYIKSAADVPRLLAAVDAALKLADEAEPVERDYGGEPIWWSLSPAELRAAITAALTGEEAGDG